MNQYDITNDIFAKKQELTGEDRKRISVENKVPRSYVSNTISLLRKKGLYKNAHSRGETKYD